MALEIRLLRPSSDVPWGFRLIGGSDFNMPLTVIKVQPSTPADMANLVNGDTILCLRGVPAQGLSHDGAYDVIKGADDVLELEVLRGRYDLVVDEQEPIIYEPYDQQDDFARPSEATEVSLLPDLDSFRPIDTTGADFGRERTESPFLLPTKPYRPFSAEPIGVSPVEDPIILNPNYHDEFNLDKDIIDIEEEYLPKTKFKLPISPFYKPEGKDRSVSRCSAKNEISKETKTEDYLSKVDETISSEHFNSCQKSRGFTKSNDISKDSKETSEVRAEVKSSVESLCVKKEAYQCFESKEEQSFEHKQEEYTKQEIKHIKQARLDIDLEKIEQTATSIVEESIERAESVAKEIKDQLDIELKSITESESKSKAVSKVIDSHEVEAKSLSVEETKLSTVKELEQIKAGTVKKTTEVFEHAFDVSAEAVVEKAKDAVSKTKTVKAESLSTQESAKKESVSTKEDIKRESISTKTVKENIQVNKGKTKTSERAYMVGLQTIPKIRGHIHSSYHFDLLLRTFFLHLTDVMVALTRFMLTQSAFDKETESATTKQEKDVDTEESVTKVVEKNVVTRDKETVKSRNEKEFVDEEDYSRTEKMEHHKKSGSKMAQLTERKSEELTDRMDAVITEFSAKAGIEETEIKVTEPEITETRISEVKTSEDIEVSELVSSKKTEYLTETKETRDRRSRSKSREGRQMYIATVESHVYTNKDEILDEQFSESSSLHSVEGTIQEEAQKVEQIQTTQIEEMKVQDVQIEQQVTKEDVVQKVEEIQKVEEVQKIEQVQVAEEIVQQEQIKQIEEIVKDTLVEQEIVQATQVEQATVKTEKIEQEIVQAEKVETEIVQEAKVEIQEVAETFKVEEKHKATDTNTESDSAFKTIQIIKEIEPVVEIQESKFESISTARSEKSEMHSSKFESKSFVSKESSFKAETTAAAVFEEISLSKKENFEHEANFEQISVEQESSFSAMSTGDRTQLRRLSLKTEPEKHEKASKSSSGASLNSFPSTIDTPTPCTVPPTPLTDEYMFRLSCEVKNLAEPEPHSPTPPKLPSPDDEDPHIVKKKLIPHIDTTIESVVYDQPKSPERIRLGLMGGSDRMTKEEIREIGRKSTLLASAIDQTIRSIEEYKEQAGIPLGSQRSSVSGQGTSAQDTLMYNGFVVEPKTTVFDQKVTASEDQTKIEQGWANVISEMKVSNGNGATNLDFDDKIKDSFDTEKDLKDVIGLQENIIESTRVEENECVVLQSTKTPETVQSVCTAEEITRQTELVAERTETEKSLELQSIVAGLITQDEGPKRNPLEGYRPVPFDPEEIRHQVLETRMGYASNILESTEIQRNSLEKVEKKELFGTHKGIVDGLEEPVIDPDIARELGKPGIPEDKIAEIISGESEMLREAHVMGLKRVIASHMCRPDETSSSVDFKKIKPTMGSLKDSEVIKALNEELTKTKTEKKQDERKWTTFLQRPTRPVPSAKFGYPGYMVEPQEVYKPKIVKQPKPKVAPDYKPEDFDTGLLPWEQRAATEPPPPPVEPEDPILIPEHEVQFLEAVDPTLESEVPDLEETGIALPPEPEPESEQPEQEEEVPGDQEQEEDLDLEQVIEETEQLVLEDMEKNQLTEQLMQNVSAMVDPNATLEQQLAQMRAQLAALAQLPCVIQQTLELVTKQLSQITQLEVTQVETREAVESTETVEEKITKTTQEIIEESTEEESIRMKSTEMTEESTEVTGATEVTQTATEEMEALKKEEAIMVAEQAVIERQKKEMMDQMQVELESRQVKQHPTPRVGKPKPMFGPLTPQERPQVLPGGRKWRKPKDAYNEAFIAETLQAQAELIQGKAKGYFESYILPYDERINFMKFEKPPVSLDHLRESDVYKLVHNMDETPVRRVDMRTPVVAECDYREKCRSMTPCPAVEP